MKLVWECVGMGGRAFVWLVWVRGGVWWADVAGLMFVWFWVVAMHRVAAEAQQTCFLLPVSKPRGLFDALPPHIFMFVCYAVLCCDVPCQAAQRG
jgi:hypothetical protein